MKRFILLFLFILFTAAKIHAQDYPDFGKPSQEDIDLKECPFEKEAAAVVLIHEAFSYSQDDAHLITTHHFKIKILKQAGVNAANITIPFYRNNNYERISNIEGVTINIDENGKTTKQSLSKKNIFTNKITNYIGEVSFTFPSVKVGSIIEYQYKSEMESYWGLRDWYFQDYIPVMISRYHLKTIFTKAFSYKVFKRPDINVTVSPENDRVFFEMLNVPALTDEPYMDSEKDYLQRVSFKVDNTFTGRNSIQVSDFNSSWRSLNSDMLYKRSFGQQIRNTITGAGKFIDSVKNLNTPEEKMKAIYDHVKSRMSWNHVTDFFSDDVNAVWESKIGSSGDINMVLMNLLNRVNLDVYPLLVSKRSHGKVDTSYARITQFNSLQTCVNIKGKKYILDATETNIPYTMIPPSVLNTTAFMIDRFSGELITLIEDISTHKEIVNIEMGIAADDSLYGSVTINSFEYAKTEKIKEIKNDSSTFKDRYLVQQNRVFNILQFNFQYPQNDTIPLTENINFKVAPDKSGEYKLIPLNIFSTFTNNPFIADSRISAVNFGYNKSTLIKGSLKLSEQYSVDALPANNQFYDSTLDIRFYRDVKFNKEQNTISFEIKVDFLKSLYETTDYPALKKMYKILFGKLAEQIVLKRKL